MASLPEPSIAFSEKKSRIVQQLAVPATEYADASPKGSVDEGIREFVDEINRADGFVTTSSCAGRVSVFLEGRKTASLSEEDAQVAGVGGKGAGGAWLYVSHEPVERTSAAGGEKDSWLKALGYVESSEVASAGGGGGGLKDRRLIHFKFEPMILHVLTTSLLHSQLLLRCALQAGFRESGAVSITPATPDDSAMPIVAVRSMGLSFESLIGYETSSGRYWLVSLSYLETIMDIANERFVENTKRIERFRTAFRDALKGSPRKLNPEGKAWEDPATRRERMRIEGLKRKAAKEAELAVQAGTPSDTPLELGTWNEP